MKKILFLLAGALVFTNLFFSTGCAEDETPDVKNAPLVTVTGAPSTEVEPGTVITVSLDATVGTDELNSLTVTEDGSNLDASRMTITGIDPANNPQLITDADKSGLLWDLTITLPDAEGTYSYEFTVADEGGLTDFDGFTVTVAKAGTPVTTLTGVLFNQAGPAGKGALDLDQGLSSGVTSDGDTTPDQTEIRDMGLDCTIPAPGFNWRRQIGAMNGSILRGVDASQLGADFSFDNVEFAEQIAEAFDTGIGYSAGESVSCLSGNTTAVEHVSEILAVGDLLVVQSSTGVNYLIRVDEVNETGADNDDSYTFSIKY